MKALLVLAVLLLPGLAQQPRALQPVRVSVVTLEDGLNQQVAAAIRAQLRAQRDIAIVEQWADYQINFNTMELRGANTCGGYFASVAMSRRKPPAVTLRGYASATISELAKIMADAIAEERAIAKGRQ